MQEWQLQVLEWLAVCLLLMSIDYKLGRLLENDRNK
jgi:hypothetical protein